MKPHSTDVSFSVSNLTPMWDGSGTYDRSEAAIVVAQTVGGETVIRAEERTSLSRRMAAPERFDAVSEPVARNSAFSYDLLQGEEPTWAEDEDAISPILENLLPRERRSAYEIVFIMLAAAVSILLAAPPLVQVLLAAHGTQA